MLSIGGNHELYRDDVVEYVQRPGGFVGWWGDSYLTSNVRIASTGSPLGHKYKVLKGKNAKVLVFGFLYSKYMKMRECICAFVRSLQPNRH